jgi:predicted nucleic acid-binding protein
VNPKKILIDTSAWIVSFKKAGDAELKEFMKRSIVAGSAVTSPIIILELVQGCRTEPERDTLKIRLESLDVLAITSDVWERSYALGFSLRREGLTIPTADLIVAATAIHYDCILLHHDRHYELIGRVDSSLQIKRLGPPPRGRNAVRGKA